MIITDVGLNMESIKLDKGGIITGKAVVYSADEDDEYGIEYTDDFDFYFEVCTGFIQCNLDPVFDDEIEVIEIKLKENLETNYLPTVDTLI